MCANITTESMDTSEPSINKKMLEQLEYYFGDINLNRDAYLQTVMKEHDGWVPIEKLLKFNRLKRLSSDLNEAVIAESVTSLSSPLLEVSDCRTKVRRRLDKPIPEMSADYKESLFSRTVHLNGFPLNATFDEIHAFCSQYGKVESLEMRTKKRKARSRLPRLPESEPKRGTNAAKGERKSGPVFGRNRSVNSGGKVFKGCAFVTYANKADAESILAVSPLKYKNHVLQKENKIQYYERRREFIETKKKNKLEKRAISELKTEPNIESIRIAH